MRRVVFDTNILISGFLFGGIPRLLLGLALRRELIAVTSPALIEAFMRVVRRKNVFSDDALRALERKVSGLGEIVVPAEHYAVLKDEPDNRVLEAAVAGQSDAIVTGDKEILALGAYEDIAIMSPASFAAMLGISF